MTVPAVSFQQRSINNNGNGNGNQCEKNENIYAEAENSRLDDKAETECTDRRDSVTTQAFSEPRPNRCFFLRCLGGARRRHRKIRLVCDNGKTATVNVPDEENTCLKDLKYGEFALQLPDVNFRNAQIYSGGVNVTDDTLLTRLKSDLLVLECPEEPPVGSIPVNQRLPLQVGQTYTLFIATEMQMSALNKKVILPEGTQVKIEDHADKDKLAVSALKRQGFIDRRSFLGVAGIPLGFRIGQIWQTRGYCTVFSTEDFSPHRLPPNLSVIVGPREVASINNEPMITIRIENGKMEAYCQTRDPVGLPTLKPGYGGDNERWTGGDWYVCADDAALHSIPRDGLKVGKIPKSSIVMLADTLSYSPTQRWHHVVTLDGKAGWTPARFASVHQIFAYHVMMYPSKGGKKVFKAHLCPEMISLRARWEGHLRNTMGMRAVPQNIAFFAEACQTAVASKRIKKLAHMLRLPAVIIVAVLLGKCETGNVYHI